MISPVMPTKTRMVWPWLGHDVDVTQCLGDPDHRGQADQHDQERTQRGAEDVSVDRPHPQHRPLIRHKPDPACGFPTGREAFPA